MIQLGLTAAALHLNAGVENKIFGSGKAAPVTLNEELEAIMKMVNSIENSSLLIKKFYSETIVN